MMFLFRKLLSFWVAGDWISSDGETYFCDLSLIRLACCVTICAYSLLILHARLKHLTMVLHALWLLCVSWRRRLKLRVDVAAAEDL